MSQISLYKIFKRKQYLFGNAVQISGLSRLRRAWNKVVCTMCCLTISEADGFQGRKGITFLFWATSTKGKTKQKHKVEQVPLHTFRPLKRSWRIKIKGAPTSLLQRTKWLNISITLSAVIFLCTFLIHYFQQGCLTEKMWPSKHSMCPSLVKDNFVCKVKNVSTAMFITHWTSLYITK